MKKIAKKFVRDTGSSSGRLLVILLGVALLGAGAYAGVSRQTKAPQQPINSQPQISSSPQEPVSMVESPHTLLYGVWEGDNSQIKAYNMETKAATVVAELPQNIKRVTAKMPDQLFYINGTNTFDHGKELVQTTFGSKTSTSLAKADDGFGIDDYMLSPDGNFITTWEVSLGQGRDVLYGGKSRVYVFSTANPSAKTLLYDEVADKPIHYPRGVTNDGTVITDMFLPNSGPGWSYGMSTSDASGRTKLDSPDMGNGTYGRQPRIAADASILSFSGYDGSKGSGTEQLQGIRKSIIVPNTVEVVDAKTLKRKKLPNISNKFLYDDTRVDKDGKHLLISQIKYINKEFEPFIMVYDMEKNVATSVPNSQDKRGFAVLSDTQILTSTPNITGQTLGNLGETYQFLNSEFSIINPKDGKTETLQISDSNMQFIGVFSNSEISTKAMGNTVSELNRDTLQMHSFVLKTNLLPNRINLQSRSTANGQNAGVQTLGIKTFVQPASSKGRIALVASVAPIFPVGFTPPPGMPTPKGEPIPENLAPIGATNPGGGGAVQPANPAGGANPAVQQPVNPDQPVQNNPAASAQPSQPAAPAVGENPNAGEVPDNPEELIPALQKMQGGIEQEAQN